MFDPKIELIHQYMYIINNANIYVKYMYICDGGIRIVIHTTKKPVHILHTYIHMYIYTTFIQLLMGTQKN